MYPDLSRFCCRPVVYLTALVTILSSSVGEILVSPRIITESKVGDTTFFNCSTNLTSADIFWYHGEKYIYIGETILYPYRGRFEIDRNAAIGSHNLVIHSVEPSDAGEYICIDDYGIGARRSANLVVLETDPVCQSSIQPDGLVGQNIFNIPLDVVQLTCTVSYHGTIAPQMEWLKVGENSPTKDGNTNQTISRNRAVYTLKLTGDISLDKSTYVCQTTWATQEQYKCYSEPIKILYFIGRNKTDQKAFRGDQITCVTTNNTIPCTNQWFHDNNTCPFSCDKTIETRYLGVYVCKLMCHVREAYYFVETLKVLVTERTTGPTSGEIVAAVLVPLMVILVAFIVVLLVRNRSR